MLTTLGSSTGAGGSVYVLSLATAAKGLGLPGMVIDALLRYAAPALKNGLLRARTVVEDVEIPENYGLACQMSFRGVTSSCL